MADHLLHRKLGFFDEPEGGFCSVVVGGETALKLDLTPDQFVHEHRRDRRIPRQTCQHHGGLPVQAIHRFQDPVRIARDIDDNIAHLATGFLADDFHEVLFFDIDGTMGAELLGQFQARLVASDARDKDLDGAGMARSECAGEPLLSRTLDQNIIAHFDPASANGPLKTVGHHRTDKGCSFGGKRVTDLRREHIGSQINVIRKAAEQVRRLIAFCPAAIVRALLAKALIVAPAIGTAATADGAFENDAIAFFYVVNRSSIFAELFDSAEDFMSENDGIIDFKLAVQILNVGTTDAAHLDLYQTAVGGNVGNRIFTDF